MPSLPFRRGLLVAVLLATALGAHAQMPRLAAVSTQGIAGGGPNALTGSFELGSGSAKTILIRALGPALQITGELPAPILTLSSASGATLATSSGWNSSDAGTMAAAGASALTQGSKDAVIVTTLGPGSYSVQVSASGTMTGIARLEVYEVNATSGSAPTLSVVARSGLSASSASLVTQVTISPGSGTRTLLLRASGPDLALDGVSNPLADPSISFNSSGGSVIASNNDWGTPVGSGLSAPTLSDYFVEAGAPQYLPGSLDSALVASVGSGSYSLVTTAPVGSTGPVQAEVYDVTPTGTGADVVSFASTAIAADNGGTNPGVVVVNRSGDTSQALTVTYGIGGTAINGSDYQSLTGSVTIPAGLSSAEILVQPNPSVATGGSESVILTLSAGSGYSLGTADTSTVTITNLPATLFIANLRTATGATGSTASGVATILLSASGNFASISLTYSNLSSDENVAHTELSAGYTGGSPVYLAKLANGQVTSQAWTIAAAGQYSAAQIEAALKSGQMGIEIDSTDFPGGELVGTFVAAAGSQIFKAPAAAPAINLSTVSQSDAARFLSQATFGPTTADIATLVSEGYTAWINNQIAMAPTSHMAATQADATAYPPTGTSPVTQQDRQAAWWLVSLNGKDQLRQRVAFALSEIFVTSDVASSLSQQPLGLANYYDLLAKDAFVNFRTLLNDVTLSPVMGNYLNMIHNAKANAAKGTAADENYAREVMQLMTIGLNELQPDGTLQLDGSGLPIATYTQDTIVQTANVFTGWGYYSTAKTPSFYGAAADFTDPMMLYPAYHDTTQKTIVGGVVIPANQDGSADLKTELDTLFNHPNTGPFIARQLIQRLVTSNPSPGYVYRVAQVFANDGTGVRGNLGAVVKAILLDYEARSATTAANAGFGKLKEPILRQTALYRAFNAASSEGRYPIFNPETNLDEAALRSPTVFNFFLPDYVNPGSLADAGLLAPEFQITTASTSISVPNNLYNSIYTSSTPTSATIVLDLTPLTSLSGNPTAMVALLNELFCSGQMSSALQQQILSGLASLPKSTASLDLARFALYLTVTSPEAAVQR